MLALLAKGVLTALLAFGFFATFAGLILTVVGLMRAVTLRRPNVPILKALAWKNIVSTPALYKDEARPWIRIHVLGFITVWIAVLLAVITGIGLNYLE